VASVTSSRSDCICWLLKRPCGTEVIEIRGDSPAGFNLSECCFASEVGLAKIGLSDADGEASVAERCRLICRLSLEWMAYPFTASNHTMGSIRKSTQSPAPPVTV